MDPASKQAKVYLVGAGPGDPGLLTLRAVECLQEADFVLHDYLTSSRTLAYVRPGAECFRVTQLPGTHAERWPRILARIIAEYRAGKVVVHLKGGDPLTFGRGAEEAEALRHAGVPYEIVPGVTAALAAAACAEIPLTHRTCASAVAFVTGHEDPDKAGGQLDWGALARFPGTLAIYMGVTQLGHIAAELMRRGVSPETPAALVHRASIGEQRSIVGTIANLEAKVVAAGVGRPSLLIIGPAVRLKPETSWFESLPLAGLRVLITRPREQATAFARRLELLGAVPEVMSVIEIRPPSEWGPADAAIDRLAGDEYDWVVFTSVNAVETLVARLLARRKDLRIFGRAKLAAIGSATAAALARHELLADLVPSEGLDSESLAARLGNEVHGRRVLLPRAAQGRELLREKLEELARVDAVTVYEQVESGDPGGESLDRLRRGQIDVVTLTSPNIAKAFLRACDPPIRERFLDGTTHLLANSQRLVEWLKGEGLPAMASAEPTEVSLVDALRGLATSRPCTR
jgi:uroporphyrinogen III methyltransferase/synthase